MTVVTVTVAISGCLGTVESVLSNPHSLDDIAVDNESDTAQDVQLRATDSDDNLVFDKSFKLAPDGERKSTKRFKNPLKNGYSYTVMVETKTGLRGEYHWPRESENGGHVYVEVHGDRIEMIEGDA